MPETSRIFKFVVETDIIHCVNDRPRRPPDGTSVTRYFKSSPADFVTWY